MKKIILALCLVLCFIVGSAYSITTTIINKKSSSHSFVVNENPTQQHQFDTNKWMEEHKPEKDVMDYMLDEVVEWIKNFNWYAWDGKTNVSEDIGNIIEKYGYDKDHYYVRISRLDYPDNPDMAYYINVIVKSKDYTFGMRQDSLIILPKKDNI